MSDARFTDAEARMFDSFVRGARKDGRTFTLRDFASVCLRAAARDYTPDSDPRGPEAQLLERYAFMFVRERLEHDRVHGCNMRGVITDEIMQHLDMIIKRLK